MSTRRTRPPSGNPYEAIGHRIAQLRRAKGINQTDLADRLGVTQGLISEYESGRIKISCDLLMEVARLLRTSADELLGLTPPGKLTTLRDQRLASKMALIDRLSKRDRDALLRTINAFLGSAGNPTHAEDTPP